jgi:hypothetical protein
MGKSALTANTTGTGNAAVGAYTMDANTTGSHNTAMGHSALGANTTGSYNIAMGREALAAHTTGNDNLAIGYLALDASIDGSNNVAVGNTALSALTSTAGNTAVGKVALATCTGSYNTAVGYQALYANTTAGNNVAVGWAALLANTTGTNNVAVGKAAIDSVTTGSQNIGMGNTTGTYAVNLTTGSGNILIGHATDTSAADSDYATGLGYNITAAAGYTTIGQSASDIRAAHGTATWATVSDERVKKDIEDSTVGLSFINDLRPRTFNYRNKGDIPEEFKGYEKDSTEPYKYATTNHGFIAQEVKEVIDNHTDIANGFKLWDVRESGQQEIAETALVPMLVKAVQELSAEVEQLKSKIEE